MESVGDVNRGHWLHDAVVTNWSRRRRVAGDEIVAQLLLSCSTGPQVGTTGVLDLSRLVPAKLDDRTLLSVKSPYSLSMNVPAGDGMQV